MYKQPEFDFEHVSVKVAFLDAPEEYLEMLNLEQSIREEWHRYTSIPEYSVMSLAGGDMYVQRYNEKYNVVYDMNLKLVAIVSDNLAFTYMGMGYIDAGYGLISKLPR